MPWSLGVVVCLAATCVAAGTARVGHLDVDYAAFLAALRYLFPIVVRAGERLGCDAELRARCREALAHLAPHAIDPKTGAVLPYEMKPDEKLNLRNAENPELFSFAVFPLDGLGSSHYGRSLKTFRARRNVNGYGWNTDSIAAARLGIADAADSKRLFPGWTPADVRGRGIEHLLPDHAARYQNYPCGLMDYYTRQPGMHVYLEGSGTLATACNEMLLQSWDGLIRVAPALPRAWDARFTLLAMGGFVVSAECRGGEALYVAIESPRGGEARLANPFDGPAVVRDGGKAVGQAARGEVVAFPTVAGLGAR